ncbi:hypothetical protein [Dysgonomonas massiliensis]|nr:hypothetical protein [Dysgonomonas massiliensis]
MLGMNNSALAYQELEYKKTDGGHAWANWRIYLMDFSSQLF